MVVVGNETQLPGGTVTPAQRDIFDPDPRPDEQDSYRNMLLDQWHQDLQLIRDRGEIPPWVEADTILQRDELRLLKLVADCQGFVETGKVIVHYQSPGPFPRARMVDRLTHDAGFEADVNLAACLNRCIAADYLRRVKDPLTGLSKLVMGEEGRWRLDVVEADEYWME